MALNAYLHMSGAVQGPIDGGVLQAGREGSILVIAYSHGLAATQDGRKVDRRHEPLVVTKEVDMATPRLLEMWGSGELTTAFRLDFWRPSNTGQEQQVFTIELVNATVTSVRQEMLNNKYPENMPQAEREHVAFTYQRITQTWHDPAISSTLTR